MTVKAKAPFDLMRVDLQAADLWAGEGGQGVSGRVSRAVLIPDGEVETSNGDFILDREAAERIIEDFGDGGVFLPVDFQHQTLGGEYASPTGQAPAAGWITKLEYEQGRGIVATIEWVDDETAELVKSRKYRYLSPVVYVDPETHRAVGLHSAALTNVPAIKHMESLAASNHGSRKEKLSMKPNENKLLTALQDQAVAVTAEQKMGELKALLESKGVELGDGADFVAILNAAIARLKGGGETGEEGQGAEEEAAVAAAVRTKLDLPEMADKNAVILKLSALLNSSGGLEEQITSLRKELGTLRDKETRREVDELVGEFVNANKLNPKDEEAMAAARELARSNREQFVKLMENTKPYAAPGATTPPDGSRAASTADGREEKLIAEALKAHDGKYKAALIGLQRRLIDEECARSGAARKTAVKILEEQYPKIFG